MIVAQFLLWYFWETPQKIIKAWLNFLKFNIEYFSIPLLIKTLFSPWRRYTWAYPRGFDLMKYLEAFFSNMISRILGMIMRIILMSIGIMIEILIFLIGMTVLVVWLTLPIILIIFLI